MGGACSAYGEERGCIGFWWGNPRERDHWGDQGVDGRILLVWIFRKWDCKRVDLVIDAILLSPIVSGRLAVIVDSSTCLLKVAMPWAVRKAQLRRSVGEDYMRFLFVRIRDVHWINTNTSQQDFVPRKIYCVSNVTFHAESKYAIKIFPSPTVFVQ
jgi:hypothetical protein